MQAERNRQDMANEIVLYQPDATIQLEVRLQNETVWLTQQQMAELFTTDRTSIVRHIANIYKSHELEEFSTCVKIAQVRQEGKRSIVRQIPYYSLDVIISVGYRVNSIAGVRFRQWANKVLKEYLLRGYSINQRLANIEESIDNRFARHERRLEAVEERIDFFVITFSKTVCNWKRLKR